METVIDFIFLGSKNHCRWDCSHEIKRFLLLERKAMTNLDSIIKSRDITLPTKVHLVKAMVFPIVMYGCKCWTIKKTECWKIDAFELWCWRRLLRVPWTARRSNQSVLKEIHFSSVAQSCPTLCDPMNCSTPGFPVHHQLPEFTQTHAHGVGDAIQPSHPLSPPSPPAPIPPSIRVFSNESVLHISWPKCWSFSFSINPSNEYSELISPLGWTGWISLQFKGLSRVFSNT